MGQSFIDVLARKIEERQRLENRPMGTLTPKLHPAELMQVELLARPVQIKIKKAPKPYGAVRPTSWDRLEVGLKSKAPPGRKSAPRKPAAPKAETDPATRPTPKVPMGVQEILAREVFTKWGAELPEAPLGKELTKAYRKLAFRLHPDRSNHPEAGAIFSDITTAYQALKSWAQKAYPTC